MNLFRKKLFRKNSENKENRYHELRQLALDFIPTTDRVKAMDSHPVYAAIVDMDMGNSIVTLVCIADGTTSLYFSTGGGQIGIGQADESVCAASIAFLHGAEQVLDALTITDEFTLPTKLKHHIYLKTMKGTYYQAFDMNRIDDEPQKIQLLNLLYQNVIMKIGEGNQRSK